MNKIIVALDLPEREKMVALAKRLVGEVGMLKVGLEAFVAFGPDFVRELQDLGHAIFLDLKLYDIPRTVGAAVKAASRVNVQLITVHASGGAEMILAAKEAAQQTQIIAVTLLTSFDAQGVEAIGYTHGIEKTAYHLGELARTNGADGLVCSAHELKTLASLGGVRVVPGIRPQSAPKDDQKRTATAQEALALGADWLVIGRPVLQASDPVQCVRSFLEQ